MPIATPDDRGDQRLVERGERAQEAESRAVLLAAALRRAQEVADVVAGGEAVARTGEHHRADRRIARRGLEPGGAALRTCPGDRVLLLGPIEAGRGDAFGGGDLDVAGCVMSGETISHRPATGRAIAALASVDPVRQIRVVGGTPSNRMMPPTPSRLT